MITKQQVQEQKARFESFLNSANLIKIGNRYHYFLLNDAKDGRYTAYCYLLRVLGIIAKVGGSYSHPDNLKKSYRDILEHKAVTAFIEHLSLREESLLNK